MQLIIQAENAEDLRFQVVTLAEEFTKGNLMATLQSKQAATLQSAVKAQVPKPTTELAPTTETEADADTENETETEEIQHVNGEHRPKAKTKKAKKSKVKNAEPEVLYEALDVEVGPEAIEPEAPAAPQVAEVTKQEVIQALQKVNSMKGLPKAKEVLVKFNCARLSDVKEAIYPQFLKACNEALA